MHVRTAKYFRSIKFSSLTESEYEGLKEQGMLYVYYPQATGVFMKDMINESIRESRIDAVGQNGNDGLHYNEVEYRAPMSDNPDGINIDLDPQAKHDGLWPYGVGDDYIDKIYNNDPETKDGMFVEPCRGHDMVSSPSHYELDILGDVGQYIQAIDIIKETLTKEEFIGYCRGNILKYSLRAHKKNGDEDLKKADIYSGWLVEVLEE